MAANKNKSTKRDQVDKDQAKILIIISIAAVITIGSLVVAKGFISQGSYLRKVIDKKEVAVDQLNKNKAAVAELTAAYETFIGQNPNLLGGDPGSQDDRGGSNADLVLDALPSKYDFPALASSIEKLLSGYSVLGITGVDESVTQQASGASGPVEIPFAVDFNSSYDGLKDLISTFNRSIRPIQIITMEVSGSNSNLQTTMQAKTFYQPETGVQITEEQVN